VAKKQQRSMPRSWADPKALAAKQGARAPHRSLWLGSGLASALILLAVIGAVLLIGSKSSHAEENTRTDHEVNALLAGIPQEGRTLGSPAAPVTLQVFADLEDEDSQRWVLTLLPAIIHQFVRTNILKIEYRSFKTNTLNPKTFVKQQTAALAASAQNKLWNYIDTFYHEQGTEYTPYVTENYIDNIASQIPELNITQWHQDRNDGRRTEQVATDDQTAIADGIHTSPAYRLGRTGDQLQNFTGSEAITFPHQHHPTTFASAKDLASAINQIH
jgi:hypothetical protein